MLYLSPVAMLLQQLTNLGQPLSGGKVYILEAGTPDTLLDSWTDSTQTTQNANPIILNSAGRMANGAGIVSVWVEADSPHKMILQDADGIQLAMIDNLPGINDPTALLEALSDVGGVDEIPNAIRSFDIFSALRASTEPVLDSGETRIVVLEGGATINDGLGGAFYWNASSAATDDSFNVIKLNATTGVGRWLRISWNAKYGLDETPAMQELGWRDMPQNIQNGNYTFALADRGKQVYHSSGGSHTYTIPANVAIAFPIGTVIDIVNDNGAATLAIAITSDTLRWAPVGSTGPRTLGADGTAVIKKITATSWQITGVGLG